MLGIWTGAFGHVLMAAAGLSAILATSATAFTLVKWAGAAYLIWLGISALRSGGGSFVANGPQISPAFFPIFRQGVVVALLNPKVAIFFPRLFTSVRRCRCRTGLGAIISAWQPDNRGCRLC